MTTRWNPSSCAALLSAIPLAVSISSAHGQPFPAKAIMVVSSASPGSTGDASVRIIATKMSQAIGQPVVVDLRSAARGAQAHAVVSKAQPDGYTVTFGTSATFVYSRFLYKNLVFDVLKDYSPVTMAVNSPGYVTVHNSLPVHSIRELVEYAKKNPGKLEYGSTGNGSFFHLSGEALKSAAGIDMLHVPYATANFPQMLGDWSTGRLAVGFPVLTNLTANASRVRVLAIMDTQRSRHMPDVPVITESLPEFQPFSIWWGFFAPPGLPAPIGNRFATEVGRALQQSDIQPKLDDLGLQVIASPPAEFAKALQQEIRVIGTLVKTIKLQPE
jgi:tripartite-type tricarboxylate transporter receptor subunit TctC